MLQAFVSLKQQQPSKTASGIKSFFEAIVGAMFSPPTLYRSSADASSKPFSIDDVCKAALDPKCKFLILRAETGRFWQCTCLLPDAQGQGALFFHLQRNEKDKVPADILIDFCKRLYAGLKPLAIRIGDSEAREKLKSRHGLVFMPGLGRVEWVQVIRPEVFSSLYNVSELAAAPAYAAEIWDDGAFFLRVYGDPNDWDNEDNVSLANFIPGFLAGIAKIEDGEKEKESVRQLEKLWSRAEKTAQNALNVMDAGTQGQTNNDTNKENIKTPEKKKDNSTELVLSAEEKNMREFIVKRLTGEYKIDNSSLTKYAKEGPCSIFSVTIEDNIELFASYQDLERKVYCLNDAEDLAKFLQANNCNVKNDDIEKILKLTKTYYKPELQLLHSFDELPPEVRNDKRLDEIKDMKPSGTFETLDGTNIIHIWFYNKKTRAIEQLKVCQFDTWALTVDAEKRIAELYLSPVPASKTEPKTSEIKEEQVNVENKKDDDKLPTTQNKEQQISKSAKSNKSVLIIGVIAIIVFVLIAVLKMMGLF